MCVNYLPQIGNQLPREAIGFVSATNMESKLKFWTDIATFVGTAATAVYVSYVLYAALQPGEEHVTSDQRRRAKASQKMIGGNIELTKYEASLLSNLIQPHEINVGFSDIGGLDEATMAIHETILFPLINSSKFSQSPLLQAPKGVLLYGPPGCGKTMLAKAMARESNANFLNVQMSTLADKWYGESNKIVAALFSLATKLSPCIIFIDEIDSFLRTRDSNDHEMSAQLKAQFMVCWDGLATASSNGVLVLGATNRIFDIDDAVLRRMPKRFEIKRPGPVQRARILKIVLQGTEVDANLDFKALVEATEGMSGSDITEFCRNAAMEPMREAYRQWCLKDTDESPEKTEKMRPLRTSDFIKVDVD